MDIRELAAKFGADDTEGAVKFEMRGELICCNIHNDACSGQLFLHGAHVAHYQPAGHQPVLFTSEQAVFRDGTAIRGGIPICFPWFGSNATDPSLPSHGLVRQKSWELKNVDVKSRKTTLELATTADGFDVGYVAEFGEQLKVTLQVHNASSQLQTFEAALHSYFQLSHIKEVLVTGLESVGFLDQLEPREHPPSGSPIAFTEETDRIYQDTVNAVEIVDDGLGRKILIEKSNSQSTVVWNPWIAKSKRMSDFGDDQWQNMCCIETANIGQNTISLEPGQRIEISATHSVVAVC
jgi:D-hexose-6-phosphate mutarotase